MTCFIVSIDSRHKNIYSDKFLWRFLLMINNWYIFFNAFVNRVFNYNQIMIFQKNCLFTGE